MQVGVNLLLIDLDSFYEMEYLNAFDHIHKMTSNFFLDFKIEDPNLYPTDFITDQISLVFDDYSVYTILIIG